MVEYSGPLDADRLEEMRAYAEKGPAVSRDTVGWAVRRIEELQEHLGVVLGDLVELEEETRRKELPVHLLATCTRCGESFVPADEQDLVHLVREDGEECGGRGELES